MDAHGFDQVSRGIALLSRREALITAGRLALVAALARFGLGAEASTAQPCRTEGAKCKRGSDCCSGTCQKRGKRGRKGRNRRKRCGPVAPPPPDAFGCTLELDSCGLETPNACPGLGSGSCFVTVNNQPFCGNDLECFACESDQDCLDELGRPGFRCVACTAPRCQGRSTFCLRLETEQ